MNNTSSKKLLYEVSIIRPLIIFLLVLLHSFAIFDGQWERPKGVDEIPIYFWFAKLISGFRIETIALVAGYIYSYQSNDLGRKYELWPFVIKKFKRLVIPALFFGIIYFLMFRNISHFTLFSALLAIVSGIGHLWFLPMLFWCFIFIWMVDRYRAKISIVLPILALLSIIPIPISLPLGFQRLPHFLFYAYGGYILYIYREQFLSKLMNGKVIFISVGLYLLLVSLQYSMFTDLGGGEFMLKALRKILLSFNKLLFSVTGIFALFLFVCRYTTRKSFKPKNWIISASSVCYGVYIYHQFILHLIYDRTLLPQTLGSFILPWIAFIITLILSLVLTFLSLKTKIGRYLIG